MQHFSTFPLGDNAEFCWSSSAASKSLWNDCHHFSERKVINSRMFQKRRHPSSKSLLTVSFCVTRCGQFLGYFHFNQPQKEDGALSCRPVPVPLTPEGALWVRQSLEGNRPEIRTSPTQTPSAISLLFVPSLWIINHRLPGFMVVCGRLIKRLASYNILRPLGLCCATSRATTVERRACIIFMFLVLHRVSDLA